MDERNLTYRELLDRLIGMTDSELDNHVSIYHNGDLFEVEFAAATYHLPDYIRDECETSLDEGHFVIVTA